MYIGIFFKVRFIQDSGVLRVRFRQVALNIYMTLKLWNINAKIALNR